MVGRQRLTWLNTSESDQQHQHWDLQLQQKWKQLKKLNNSSNQSRVCTTFWIQNEVLLHTYGRDFIVWSKQNYSCRKLVPKLKFLQKLITALKETRDVFTLFQNFFINFYKKRSQTSVQNHSSCLQRKTPTYTKRWTKVIGTSYLLPFKAADTKATKARNRTVSISSLKFNHVWPAK